MALHPDEVKRRQLIAVKKWRDAHPEKVKADARKYYQANIEKYREYAKAWRAAKPKVMRERGIQYRAKNYDRICEYFSNWQAKKTGKKGFRLAPGQYALMLQAQNNICKICGSPPGRKRLVVDHDHETGSIRGLLCDCCNLVLGHFNDDAKLFRRALLYLEEAAKC